MEIIHKDNSEGQILQKELIWCTPEIQSTWSQFYEQKSDPVVKLWDSKKLKHITKIKKAVSLNLMK